MKNLNWRRTGFPLVGVLSAGLLLVSACETGEDAEEDADDSGCQEPLSEWCGDADAVCQSWEEAKAEFESHGRSCDAQEGREYRYGTCGDYFYAESPHDFGVRTQYFDTSGVLIGASDGSDVASYCRDSHSAEFGIVPDCTKRVEYESCPELDDSEECQLPLSDWCGDTDDVCLEWDLVKDNFDGEGTSCDEDAGIEYKYGSCGDYWFAEVDHEFGGWTSYFDAAGQMIGLRDATDVNIYCDGTSFRASFGVIPDCEEATEYESCSEDPEGVGGAGGAGGAPGARGR